MTTVAEIPAVSREFLYVPGIKAFAVDAPDAAVNPTSLTVEFAFVVGKGVEPGESAWHAGQWVNDSTARVLLGPGGGLVLATGPYEVWLRVLGAVEQPERRVGALTVK